MLSLKGIDLNTVTVVDRALIKDLEYPFPLGH